MKRRMSIQNRDEELIRFISGEDISDARKGEIREWIESKEENREYFNQVKKIWEEKKFLNQFQGIDPDKGWKRFRESLSERPGKPPPVVRINRVLLTRIAAAILLIVSTTTAIYYASKNPGQQIKEISSVNENTEIILNDGSIISLKAGSTLKYPEKYDRRKREVTLSGEAFFKVEESDGIPFFIYAGKSTVKVIGTSFNVRAAAGSPVKVSVISGKVLFYESGNERTAVTLDAGHYGSFYPSSGKVEKGTFESENFLFWKTSRLSFNFDSLANVFKDIQEYYNTTIIVEDNSVLGNKLTTVFEGQSLEDVLTEMAFHFDLDYYHRGDTVFIQSKPE